MNEVFTANFAIQNHVIMIIITGAAGFIGSYLTGYLNAKGYNDLVLSDDFSKAAKKINWESKNHTAIVNRDDLPAWLQENHAQVQFIFHLGARTDTTEMNKSIFAKLNVNYSKEIWKLCVQFGIPLVYASSAATYGDGSLGYKDDHGLVQNLQPLNPYGRSKNDFDLWALKQKEQPRFWAGLKFFNVYGPNEYHKGRMASVVFHAFNQLQEKGNVTLFRSHRSDFRDGEQKRDFIYVKDIASICYFFMHNRKPELNGIYNAGTGKAGTFLELARALFQASGKPENIRFIDTPEDIRDTYQYFTEADMQKLRNAGYQKDFYNLEDGVRDYVENFLLKSRKIF